MGLRDRAAAVPAATSLGASAQAAPTAAKPAVIETPPAAAQARPSSIPDGGMQEKEPAWAAEPAADADFVDLVEEPPVAGASMGIPQGERLADTHEGEFDVNDAIELEPAPAAQALATRSDNAGALAQPAAGGGFLHTQQQLEDQGYATDVSFGTFPNLVLNNLGQFECKDWDSGPLKKLTALHVIVVQVKRKWLYREKKEKGAKVRYSYDLIPYPKNQQAADAQGNPIKAFVDMLVGEGAQWESKMYYEALAVVVGGEGEGWQDHEGTMVLISMSPTSKAKWSGYTIQTKMLKRCLPHEVVTRVACGPSMTVQNQNFFPLAFKALRRADLGEFANASGFEVTADAE